MQTFTTAARNATDDTLDGPATVEFTVDDQVWTAVRPKSAQLAYLAQAGSTLTADADKAVHLINFVEGVLDEPSRAALRKRLLDPADPFDMPDLNAIMSWLLEGWTGRPPTSPQDSSTWPPRNGLSSTARARSKASTPSRSASTGSAT